MKPRMLICYIWCYLWAILGAGIMLGFFDKWLGDFHGWKRFLAMAICTLMGLLGTLILRFMIKSNAKAKQTHDQPT